MTRAEETTQTAPFVAQMPELNRRLRGHSFYPTAAQLARIPGLHGQDGLGTRARVHLHYFNASSDWYITELDPADGHAYGWACLNGDTWNAEWGYVDLVALESVSGRLGVLVERDRFWTPGPAAEVIPQLRKADDA
ncbi:DUF2958 domain-containing protein [Streptomyces sp. cg36]|uniref:DUF2958 domain-containing protein n=1 Tax=Streptomyces sp. cg36 TaxID=3238798 RepID=UPI0034E29970